MRAPIIVSSAPVCIVAAMLSGCGDDEDAGTKVAQAAPAAAGSGTPVPSPDANGLTRFPVSRVLLKGSGPVDVKSGLDTVVFRFTLAPGGTIGWHTHPGSGAFMIDKGVITNYGLDGPPCKPRESKAGEGYFVSAHPHHPHLVKNNGTETAEVTVHYVNVPVGQPTLMPAERPKECPESLQ
jgi:quercetin dioxygenase-like cupin family protein